MGLWRFVLRCLRVARGSHVLDEGGAELMSPSQELRHLEIGLKNNMRWVDAAIDQNDRYSFVLACRQRAQYKRALERLLNGGTDER